MLVLFIILCILVVVAERYFLEHALDDVTFDTYPSIATVDPEEVFTITSVIENKKRMPVSFLRVRESLPEEITIFGEGVETKRDTNGVTRLSYSLYLKGKGKVTRTITASLPKRGRYFLRGAALYGGDFLGLQENVGYSYVTKEIVVLPAKAQSPALEDAMGGFLGELSVNRFIMEDPILTLGFREYTGAEPMRAISWSQSAKGMGMMVKKYDYTTEPSVTVLLSVQGGSGNEIEGCFSLTRGVCEALEAKGIRYDFLTNATSAGAIGIWNKVSEGSGHTHLTTILEGLGRATYACTESLSATLDRAYRRSDNGRCHILILPHLTPDATAYSKRFQAVKGGKMLILTSEEGYI